MVALGNYVPATESNYCMYEYHTLETYRVHCCEFRPFFCVFQEHRRNCERQGKYVEAEIAKNRLDELKLHEENRRKVRRLNSRQVETVNRCRRSSKGAESAENYILPPTTG